MNITLEDAFVSSLPGDPERKNYTRQVPAAAYSFVEPTPVASPRLIAYSAEVAGLLGISNDDVQSEPVVAALAGNGLMPGSRPYAANYGGHQFGNGAGQLGDGRAIGLGEKVGPDGRRWELQLKGAGPTPYSRRADGRAVLRSSVREFLCSEAMYHLGVPTTRALSLVATGDPVLRDMFYDGRAANEPGAIVCRVAPSFLRFGSFEIHAARNDKDTLRVLTEYVLRNYYPHHLDAAGGPTPAAISAMLVEIAERTALMVCHWQRVGFVHGVMNTDNMSILGLTIDYGPYGWLEPYDPGWTPNTTDASGKRYRFGNQPSIAQWNLARLAEALYPLVGEAPPLEAALERYKEVFEREHGAMWCAKLGLSPRPEDADLLQGLHETLCLLETDYTLFFRGLAEIDPANMALPDKDLLAPFAGVWYAEPTSAQRTTIAGWVRTWAARAATEGVDHATRRERMNRVNPKYVLRNWLAQEAIDLAEAGDPSRVTELLDVLRRPYDEQPGNERFAARRPEWARNRAGCSMLSCSS